MATSLIIMKQLIKIQRSCFSKERVGRKVSGEKTCHFVLYCKMEPKWKEMGKKKRSKTKSASEDITCVWTLPKISHMLLSIHVQLPPTLQAAENAGKIYWYKYLELFKVHYGHSSGSFYSFSCAKISIFYESSVWP